MRECRTCRRGRSCRADRCEEFFRMPNRGSATRFIGIAAAAAVADADVEQSEIGRPGARRRIERDRAAVVIRERLAPPHQLARRVAIVGGAGRSLGGPFEQHQVVRGLRIGRREVGLGRHVRTNRSRCRACRTPACRPARTADAARSSARRARGPANCTGCAHFGSLMLRYGVTVLPSALTV